MDAAPQKRQCTFRSRKAPSAFVALVLCSEPHQGHVLPPVAWASLGLLLEFAADVVKNFTPKGLLPDAYKAVTFLGNGTEEIAIVQDEAAYISVVSLSAESVLRQFGRLKSPKDIAALADGVRVVVANSGDRSLLIYDTNTCERLAFWEFAGGITPYAVTRCPTDGELAVCFHGGRAVSIVDEELEPLREFRQRATPAAVRLVSNATNIAFLSPSLAVVADYTNNQLAAADPATGIYDEKLGTLAMEGNPFGMFSVHGAVYVSQMSKQRLVRVTVEAGRWVTDPVLQFATSYASSGYLAPRGSAVSADGSRAVVVCHGGRGPYVWLLKK